MESTIPFALQWAERGFRVFPLLPLTKKPRDKAFYNTATRDPDAVRRLFEGADNYNIGLSTDDRLVVDIDRKNGVDGLTAFVELDPPLRTLVVGTPTGGFHYHYRARPTRNTTGKLGPGIDTRSHHGYVLAPGSVTPEGRYTLDLDAPVAEAPESLLRRLEGPRLGHEGGLGQFYDDEIACALGLQLLASDTGGRSRSAWRRAYRPGSPSAARFWSKSSHRA